MRPAENLPVTVSVPAKDYARWVESYSALDPNRPTPAWLTRTRVDLDSVLTEAGRRAVLDALADVSLSCEPAYEALISSLRDGLGVSLREDNEGPLLAPDDGPNFPGCLGIEGDSYWTLVNEHIACRLAQSGVRKVLEVGAGFFSLTKVLACHGFEVTVVEPNAHAEQLMKKQGLDVVLQNVPFSQEALLGQEYDAVLFMESFHHMPSPVRALEWAFEVAPRIFLCAEPITSDRSIVPYPWGPRLDGESMYAMLCHGWNENGFTPEFIEHLAARHNGSQVSWAIPGIHHSHIVSITCRGKA